MKNFQIKVFVYVTDFLNNSQYLKSKVVYCYYSVNKEVDLLPFIKQALEDGKIIAFPKVKRTKYGLFLKSNL